MHTMKVTPKCPLSFYTLLWVKKRINIIRNTHSVSLNLLMSNLFSYKLGVAALLATSLVCLATVVFIIFEQTSQISALQETLHALYLKAVSDHIQYTDSTSEDITPE